MQNEFPHAVVGTDTSATNYVREVGATLGSSIIGALFTSRLAGQLAGAGDALSSLGLNANSFLYLAPLLLVGAACTLMLKERPLKETLGGEEACRMCA